MNAITTATVFSSKSSTCCSMPIAITLITLSIIITGVVMALFMSQGFIAICFLLTGTGTSYLGMKAHSSEALIAKMTLQIHQDVVKIEEATQQARVLNQNLAQERVELAENRRAVQQEVERFQRENIELREVQVNWEREREELKQNNRNLEKANLALAKQVEQLHHSYEGLKTHLRQFLNANLELAQHMESFQQTGEGIQDTAKNLKNVIHDLDQRFDENTDQLDLNIQAGQKALQEIIQFMDVHEKTQKSELEELKQAVLDLRRGQAEWVKERQAVENQRQQIAKDQQVVDTLRENLSNERKQIELAQKQIQEETVKIDRERKKIGEDLKARQEKILQSEKRAQASVEAFSKMVVEKQQLLASLDQKIQNRLDELKELRIKENT